MTNNNQEQTVTEYGVTSSFFLKYYRWGVFPLASLVLVVFITFALMSGEFLVSLITLPLLLVCVSLVVRMSFWNLAPDGIKVKEKDLVPWENIAKSFYIPFLNIFILIAKNENRATSGLHFTVSHPAKTYSLWEALRKRVP